MSSIKKPVSPRVSIIVPVYGVEKYLRKCVNSLIDQTFRNIEIILVDDGSKDGSGKICDEYAVKYPVLVKVIHQKNMGLGGARNTGIKAACGEYLLFVDSDDYLRIDAVEIAYKAIVNRDVDIVGFGIHFVNDKGREIKTVQDGPVFDRDLMLRDNKEILLSSPSAWNKIYRTGLFTEHNLWFPQRAWHEDVRTTFKIYTVTKSVQYIADCLYYYVQRNDSITHNANVERNSEMIDAIEDVVKYYKSKGIFTEYYSELEYIAIVNMYNSASARVASADPRNHLLDDFRKCLVDNFPNYKSNKYLKQLSMRQKLLFLLVEKRLYGLLKFMNAARSAIDGRS